MTPGREVTVSHNGRLTIALLIAILVAACTGAWWAARIDLRLTNVEAAVREQGESLKAYQMWPPAVNK